MPTSTKAHSVACAICSCQFYIMSFCRCHHYQKLKSKGKPVGKLSKNNKTDRQKLVQPRLYGRAFVGRLFLWPAKKGFSQFLHRFPYYCIKTLLTVSSSLSLLSAKKHFLLFLHRFPYCQPKNTSYSFFIAALIVSIKTLLTVSSLLPLLSA